VKARTPGLRNGADVRELPATTDRDGRRAAVIAMIESRGLRPRQAALAVGIPSSTWYDMIEADPELQSDCERAAARFEAAMVGSILKDAFSLKSWRPKLALLQAVAPWWVAPQKVDLDATINEPSREERMAESMTEAELDAEMERLAVEALVRLPDDRLEAALVERRRRRRAAAVGSVDRTPPES
jgi:hypothetical protein